MFNNESSSIKRILAVAALALAVVGVVFVAQRQKTPTSQELGHGGPLESINYVAIIGSAASPSTLTTSYSAVSSTPILAMGLPNITISGSYTPKSYGSQALLLLERSVDNGATYQPYTILEPRSSDILVYTSGTGTTAGVPFVIPGTTGSASGTAIGFSFDMSVVADYLRFSAKEATTSTAGTLSVRGVLTSN